MGLFDKYLKITEAILESDIDEDDTDDVTDGDDIDGDEDNTSSDGDGIADDNGDGDDGDSSEDDDAIGDDDGDSSSSVYDGDDGDNVDDTGVDDDPGVTEDDFDTKKKRALLNAMTELFEETKKAKLKLRMLSTVNTPDVEELITKHNIIYNEIQEYILAIDTVDYVDMYIFYETVSVSLELLYLELYDKIEENTSKELL